ncbi:MAG: DUF4352 domain-containing protein [Desulfurococcales archaeon]|nr:DUF4352 domain-containing protein [Desulfurococcales archaeon]
MKARKGISPVIATVIIVAVAIAISIAVAGWLFGLWSGLAGGSPQIQISSATVYEDGTVEMYVVNSGSGADKIIKVTLNTGTNTYTLQPNTTEIPANFKGWVTATPPQGTTITLTPGQTVSITVTFEKSGDVPLQAVVKAGTAG